jgi:hypothetical protein
VSQKAPFENSVDHNELKKCYFAIRELTEAEEAFFGYCVLGYNFLLYFDLLEKRFGKEPARITLEFLIALELGGDLDNRK